MTKKNLILLTLAVVLSVVYAVYFTDWFRPKTMQIFHTSRNLNLKPRAQRMGAIPSLIFGVSRQVTLTEIKVVPLARWETNQEVLPIWHLESDSNSVPLKTFFYGQPIKGMRPAIKGTHAELPETNVVYRIFVTAGKIKGQHDFELK
jgi:hypothetical protein